MKHIPADPNAQLVLRTKIDGSADRLEQNIYKLRVCVLICNLSDIPAESPLILFPKFGLDIRPIPPMVLEPTISGPHKILACKSRSHLQIAPKGKYEACTILTTYNRATGRFAFTPNTYHRAGEEMGDLTVLCATGAANFPLRQAQVIVQASDLQATINSFLKKVGDEPAFGVSEDYAQAPIALSA